MEYSIIIISLLSITSGFHVTRSIINSSSTNREDFILLKYGKNQIYKNVNLTLIRSGCPINQAVIACQCYCPYKNLSIGVEFYNDRCTCYTFFPNKCSLYIDCVDTSKIRIKVDNYFYENDVTSATYRCPKNDQIMYSCFFIFFNNTGILKTTYNNISNIYSDDNRKDDETEKLNSFNRYVTNIMINDMKLNSLNGLANLKNRSKATDFETCKLPFTFKITNSNYARLSFFCYQNITSFSSSIMTKPTKKLSSFTSSNKISMLSFTLMMPLRTSITSKTTDITIETVENSLSTKEITFNPETSIFTTEKVPLTTSSRAITETDVLLTSEILNSMNKLTFEDIEVSTSIKPSLTLIKTETTPSASEIIYFTTREMSLNIKVISYQPELSLMTETASLSKELTHISNANTLKCTYRLDIEYSCWISYNNSIKTTIPCNNFNDLMHRKNKTEGNHFVQDYVKIGS